MPAVARVGDIFVGVCRCHRDPISVTGTIISGSSNITVDGMPLARIGDMVMCSCGHVATIVSGGKNSGQGMNIARVGDVAAGCPVGTLVSGSGSTDSL